jgi:RNA polymerase sigma-70 factor (ECF subfamily)
MIKGWLNPNVSPEILLTRYIATSKDKYLTLLVQQFNQPIYHYLLSQSDKEIAEDIIQSMWLKVMKVEESHQAHNNVKSWLFTIARHTLIDELRRQNRWHTQSFDEQITSDESNLLSETVSLSLEQASENNDRLAAFNQAINILPFYQREAFIFQQEGLSVLEIAELTDESFETIKSRLRYARTHIKNFLDNKS